MPCVKPFKPYSMFQFVSEPPASQLKSADRSVILLAVKLNGVGQDGQLAVPTRVLFAVGVVPPTPSEKI